MTADVVGSFSAFMKADEVEEVFTAFKTLLGAAGLDEFWAQAVGLARYDKLKEVVAEVLPFKAKALFTLLSEAVDKREPLRLKRDVPFEVHISGAGPVGLRAAVECVLLGMKPTVYEKRLKFSRANILTLWNKTLKDLLSLGAKAFYPELKVNGENLHMGTREIQLVLLKTALLLGVDVHYGVALSSLVVPAGEAKWRVQGLPQLQGNAAGALDFKPLKTGDYTATFKCNMVEEPAVNPEFFLQEAKQADTAQLTHSFDALLVAEGEWSRTCRNLGVKKTVDRFAQALGLVVNLEFDKANAQEKKLQDFVGSKTWGAWREGPVGKLHQAGLLVETVEYLKGSTHYIVVTIARESLLKFGVLRKDAGANSAELLDKDNVNVEELHVLARLIATTIGLPSTAALFHTNPVQLFDFSTRARCKRPTVFLHPEKLVSEVPVEQGEGEGEGGGVCVAPVFPIGDAQTEPFWPQGLGTNRGFHGAMDAVFACLCQATQGLEPASRERDFAFSCLNAVAWTPAILTEQSEWSADPLSRYSARVCEMARNMTRDKQLPLPPRFEQMRFTGAFTPAY